MKTHCYAQHRQKRRDTLIRFVAGFAQLSAEIISERDNVLRRQGPGKHVARYGVEAHCFSSKRTFVRRTHVGLALAGNAEATAARGAAMSAHVLQNGFEFFAASRHFFRSRRAQNEATNKPRNQAEDTVAK